MKTESFMRIASCPHCGQREPRFDAGSATVTCPRCRNTTQLLAASDFLAKANALWPGAEVTLRGTKRITEVIKKHDAYLKGRGDYDIIGDTLDENWQDDGGHIYDVDTDDAA